MMECASCDALHFTLVTLSPVLDMAVPTRVVATLAPCALKGSDITAAGAEGVFTEPARQLDDPDPDPVLLLAKHPALHRLLIPKYHGLLTPQPDHSTMAPRPRCCPC